jgi:hypothetical protein
MVCPVHASKLILPWVKFQKQGGKLGKVSKSEASEWERAKGEHIHTTSLHLCSKLCGNTFMISFHFYFSEKGSCCVVQAAFHLEILLNVKACGSGSPQCQAGNSILSQL